MLFHGKPAPNFKSSINPTQNSQKEALAKCNKNTNQCEADLCGLRDLSLLGFVFYVSCITDFTESRDKWSNPTVQFEFLKPRGQKCQWGRDGACCNDGGPRCGAGMACLDAVSDLWNPNSNITEHPTMSENLSSEFIFEIRNRSTDTSEMLEPGARSP